MFLSDKLGHNDYKSSLDVSFKKKRALPSMTKTPRQTAVTDQQQQQHTQVGL